MIYGANMKKPLRIHAIIFLVLSFCLIQTGQSQINITQVYDLTAVDITNAQDGSNRLFFVTIPGVIRIAQNGVLLEQPFLDIRNRVGFLQEEQGLLSMVFPPGFGNKTHFYVYYTNTMGNSVISRFQISADPNVALVESEEIILGAFQPFANHNGGRLQFGPDGMLYFGFGDGGGGNDPEENGQDLTTLLGKIIRIDVESGEQPYGIPDDNPFVGVSSARDEIWALGLRNPFRMAFDKQTGDLYIADVGQASLEEVNFQPASSSGGENYGWNLAEGTTCITAPCTGLVPPAFEYTHSEGCSITGGEVYRGEDYPDFEGVYFFGDFCFGTIWGIRQQNGVFSVAEMADTSLQIITFGQDELGNIYIGAFGGTYIMSDGPPAEGSFPLSGHMSGSWVGDGLNNQGLLINVGETANGQPFLGAAWFLFLNGQPFWITGNAFFEYGTSTITFPMRRAEGLEFLNPNGASATRTEIGTFTLRALECNRIEVDYNFPDFGTGVLEMDRLVAIQGAECD